MDRAEDLELVSVFNAADYRRGACAGLSTYDGRDSLAEIIVAERSADPDDIESAFRPTRIRAIAEWREKRKAEKQEA